jgi:hypothetical protein
MHHGRSMPGRGGFFKQFSPVGTMAEKSMPPRLTRRGRRFSANAGGQYRNPRASGFNDGVRWRRAELAAAFLERNSFRLNRYCALDLWWSMIFSENRCPLFRIML